MPVSLDVQNEDATAALAERVYREWGHCDLLINNAAIAPPRPALEDSIRRWRLAVDINVNGPFSLTWHFGRRMIEQGVAGRIDIPIWSEGFEATLPSTFDTSGFEDAAIMTDAVLWLVRQDLSFTGKILLLTELRRQGIVRPETLRRS